MAHQQLTNVPQSQLKDDFSSIEGDVWKVLASFWRNYLVCWQYFTSVSGACRQCVSCFGPTKQS